MLRNTLLIFSFFISGIIVGQDIKKIKITDLEKTIAGSKTPLIINFWASWCKPCLEEIPYFMEEVKKHDGSTGSPDNLQLLLVSLDMDDAYPVQIRKTMARIKITVPVQWLDETNADYFCPKIDPKWSGAIPATLFVNNQAGYRKFFEDQLSEDKLKQEIRAMFGIH